MKRKQRRALRARADDIEDRSTDHGPGRPGGPAGFTKPRKRPKANAEYMRRLRKQRPELHRLVLTGAISVYQATVAAGFRAGRRKLVVPAQCDISGIAEMRLWLGPLAGDEEERRLWFEHRTRLLEWFGGNGRRPQAWWRYEAPFKYPGFSREKSALWEAGLLGAEEAAQLEQEWREEFVRSLAPDFSFHDGPRGILTGREAHIAHLVFHDVPAELVERWAAEPPEPPKEESEPVPAAESTPAPDAG
jgi:hypothetical protein